MRRIYIAGPLTHGNQEEHVANAMAAADALISAGIAPFVPHLFVFQHAAFPHDYAQWLAIDFAWLRACDGCLRLPGYSPGADRETAFSAALGIPVFFTVGDVIAWAAEEDGAAA